MGIGKTPNADEKRERLIEAAMALLQAAPAEELKVVLLNKALFYLDLFALRDTGEPATGAMYLALEQGPVVANYPKRLVRALEKAGLAEQTQDGMAKPIRVKRRLSSFPHLDPSVLEHAQELGREIAQVTSATASKFSHENPGWRLAYDTGLGGPAGRANEINMLVALQQLADIDDDDRDPWLSQEADARLLKALRDTANGLT